MKILPITNQNNKNSFKSNYLAQEARLLLRNPHLFQKGLFKDGVIYKELAKFDYHNRLNHNGLFNMFKYATNTLKVKDEELRPDIAISEGIKNQNVEFLRVLMEERELVPYMPNGEISVDVILEGKHSPNPEIRSFFEDRYLEKRAFNRELLTLEETLRSYTIIEGIDIYQERMGIKKPDLLGKFFNESSGKWLNRAKQSISNDEEKFGEVRIATLERIVNHESFEAIKDESLNISGSKILHLLAEIYINPNNTEEMELLNSIMRKCRQINYDYELTNDFGETAMDKALEAENRPLIKALKNEQRRNQ